PGVGHFGQMSNALDRLRLRQAINESISSGKSYLGICLGMQILFETSEESTDSRGLGIFKGIVPKLKGSPRIPHMGWNSVRPFQKSSIVCEAMEHFYFAHSYAINDFEFATCGTTYGESFMSAIEHNNVFGVQFHPEKSGRTGEQLLRRFAEISQC